MKKQESILKVSLIIFVFCFLFISLTTTIQAQTETETNTEIEYPSFWDMTPPSDLAGWIAYVVKILVFLGVLLAVLQIVWAGVKYTSSSVDPSQKQDAKDRLKYAIIGLILLFSFFVILQTMSPGFVNVALKEPAPPKEFEIKMPGVKKHPDVPQEWASGGKGQWSFLNPNIEKQWNHLDPDLKWLLGCMLQKLPKNPNTQNTYVRISSISDNTLISPSPTDPNKSVGDELQNWCDCSKWNPKEHKCSNAPIVGGISCHYGGDKFCRYKKSLSVDMIGNQKDICDTARDCTKAYLENRTGYTYSGDETICMDDTDNSTATHISIGNWPIIKAKCDETGAGI
mgnify:CR=1 FL=1